MMSSYESLELLVFLKLYFSPRISDLVLRHRCQGAWVLPCITQKRGSRSVGPAKTGREGRDLSASGSGRHVKPPSMTAQWWISKIGKELARSFIGNSGCRWTYVKMGSWSVFPSKKMSTRLEIFLRIKRNWKKHLSSRDLFFYSSKAGYYREEEASAAGEEEMLSSEGKHLSVKRLRHSG